ncbi:MAG: hypothetical protein ACFFG0_03305 [Candidatus Thorarchaeota archaeon]
MEKTLPPKFKGIKKREFIEVIVAEGKGTNEEPIREVHYFLDEEGHIKFVEDPHEI